MLKPLKFQYLFFATILALLIFSCASPPPKDINNDGGLRFTVEMDIQDIIRMNIIDNNDSAIIMSFIKAEELNLPSEEAFGELFIKSLYGFRGNNPIASYFKIPGLSPNANAEDCLKGLYKQIDICKKEAIQVLTNRIKNYGIEGAQIHGLGNQGRILIEIPGITEKGSLRNLLQIAGNLEFYETYENAEIYPLLENVNKKLSSVFSYDSIKQAKTEISKSQDNSSLLEQLNSKEKIYTDSVEAMKISNPLWSRLTPSIKYNERTQPIGYGEGPLVGYASAKDTNVINDFLSNPEIKRILPRYSKFLWAFKALGETNDVMQLIAIRTERNGNAQLSGSFISSAKIQYMENGGGKPSLSIDMIPTAAHIWKNITRNNIGKSIAIVLDNKVYSFPRINAEIPNGATLIEGSFTIEEANELVNLLNSGYMGYDLRIIEESIVAPASAK